MELGDVVAESALRSASSLLSSPSLRRSREPLAEENCVFNRLKVRFGDAVAPDSASGCDPVSLVKSPGAWSWSTAGAIQPCEGIAELAWLSIEIAFLLWNRLSGPYCPEMKFSGPLAENVIARGTVKGRDSRDCRCYRKCRVCRRPNACGRDVQM